MPTANLPSITHAEATRATLDKPAPTALSIAMGEAVAKFAAHKTASAYHRALLSRQVVDPRCRRKA